MNLARLSISRHVLAAALSLVIMLLGIIGFGRIGVDRSPDVDFPVLTISTALPGGAPDTVAETVTRPLESRLNTISGIDVLSSTSVTGWSQISVAFDASKNMAEALNDVQSRVSQARRDLPMDAEASIVQKFDMNAQPVMWMTLSGSRSPSEITVLAKQIQSRLETTAGVGEVRLRGEIEQVMRVTVDDRKLSALALTYADIQGAFSAHHINTAGGRLKTSGREYQVEMDFEFQTPAALAGMPLTQRGGRTVRLGDVASIAEEPADTRSFAKYNGAATVAIGVVKGSGSNPVQVIETVRARVDEELRPLLPGDVSLSFVSDEAKPIREIVGALQSHLIEGTLLTAAIVWLFLKSVRATTIVATAIPVSLLGAIAGLFFAGFTFNSLTLLALLLLIGVVVDDAIVVLENIFKTQEHEPALSTREAAEKGASEVMFAVMAATLTLVCVFGPVLFLPGILGKFFKSFAATVVIGVLVSWFVSMTLTPMLCSRYLRVAGSEHGLYAWLERAFRRMENGYRRLLAWSLARRGLVLVCAAATLLPAGALMGIVKKEFAPQVDEGRVAVSLNVPGGMSRSELMRLAQTAERQIGEVPEVQSVLTTFNDGGRSGSDSVSISLVLRPERHRSQQALIQEIEQRLRKEPAWRAQVAAAAGMTGPGGAAPLQFFLLGQNYAELTRVAQQLQETVSGEPGLQGLRNNLNIGLPQLAVQLDAAEAARSGVTPRAAAAVISALTGQAVLGRYTAGDGERHDIVLQGSAGVAPASPEVLRSLKVRAASGELIELSSVLKLVPQGAPAALQRVNQQYAVTFSATPTVSLGEAVASVNKAAATLPAGYSVKYSGQAEEFRKVGGSLGMVFSLALILLYLVLASQFNSYGQPLLVMLAQPLAVIGGIGALAATGQTLNIFSMIGLVLLVGLVTKNSILLVDRANQLVAAGKSVDDALRQACPERLRPVLMTSLTVILAMLPAGLGLGAGAESNQPLSIAVIGGMVSSTLLTLVVVPAAYSLFRRRHGQANHR